MHIPRQSDGSCAGPPAGADELRARRRHLMGQLHSVGYWQRLVRARTDLSVAGLLYAAPSPATAAPGGSSLDRLGSLDPVGLLRPGGAPDHDVRGLASPPDGVDVEVLLGGPAAHGPGEDLDRLREVSALLVGRRRALQDELDAVTAALHERLARDGADAEPTTDRLDGRAALA